MPDAPQETNAALARIESAVNYLKDSFAEFKTDHKSDINLLHTLREKDVARIKVLEDELLKRQGGWISARTFIEAVIGLAALAYYLTEMHK